MSALRTVKARDAAAAASFANEAPATEDSESKGVEDFAAMAWSFVATSDQLVQGVDAEVGPRLADYPAEEGMTDAEQDEVRLLRLRTKKQEIVVVPDAKYLLTVVHDTPSA